MEKLIQYYHEKKLAHAYLIATNNIEKCYKVLLKVIKNIFCNDEFSENCNKCSLCHLIDLGNLPSLKVISPEGNFIKKEAILDLRNSFSRNSQYTNESIYIIKNAEKMNKESANTMLKFLEEPEGNVIGFFLTNSKDNVLLTIQSRCEILEIIFSDQEYEKYNITSEEYQQYLELIKEYLVKIEVEKKNLILYNKEYLMDVEKDKIKIIFQIILDIYKKALDNKFNLIQDQLEWEFLESLGKKNIKTKMQLIVNFLQKLNYNINLDLLLDSFIIEMEEVNNAIV